jgi:hypothetical protein
MKTLVIICALVAALALPTAAVAGSSQNGYSNVAGVPASGVGPEAGGGQAPAAVQATDSGSLPFTGLEIGLVAGGGLLLLAAGFTLRQIGTQRK